MPISRVRCTTLIDSTLAMPKATDTATKNEIIAVDRLCERSAFISCALLCIQLSALSPVSAAMRARHGICAAKMSFDGEVDDGHAAGQVEQRLRLLQVEVDVALVQLAHAQLEDAGDVQLRLAALRRPPAGTCRRRARPRSSRQQASR